MTLKIKTVLTCLKSTKNEVNEVLSLKKWMENILILFSHQKIEWNTA